MEKTRHASQPGSGGLAVVVGRVPDGEGSKGAGGLIRGAGATPLSGRVSVLARRMVPAEGGLMDCLVVGIGTSAELKVVCFCKRGCEVMIGGERSVGRAV